MKRAKAKQKGNVGKDVREGTNYAWQSDIWLKYGSGQTWGLTVHSIKENKRKETGRYINAVVGRKKNEEERSEK